VAASALYRNPFSYRVVFSQVPSDARSPAGLVTVAANGHAINPVNPRASVVVGYAGADDELTTLAPLRGSGARHGEPALLRVSIQGIFPGWLTAYTSVRLACD
jgi:hypothetical protein